MAMKMEATKDGFYELDAPGLGEKLYVHPGKWNGGDEENGIALKIGDGGTFLVNAEDLEYIVWLGKNYREKNEQPA